MLRESKSKLHYELNKYGKFGISFESLKKKYFKEYNKELYGVHSPGPCIYEMDKYTEFKR